MEERRPLHGIRVVDFSMHMAGPFCSRALVDLGADVIKVEPPEGDNLRNLPPLRNGVSSYFGHVNVGKKSVVLNLKDEGHRAAAEMLAREADIVLENGRPGVMKSLGLGYEDLQQANPGLIYCSISGYGQDGPGAHRPAYAMTIHAACGVDMAQMAYQGSSKRPPNVGVFTADFLGGVYALSGILAALYDRERTGRGQCVDVALMDCMLSTLPYEVQESQFPSERPRNTYKPLSTADGNIMLALVTPKNFDAVFEIIGREEWKQDHRYGTPSGRSRNWDDLFSQIQEWTICKTTDQCHELFSKAGVPVAKYQTVAEAMRDPHLAFRKTLTEVSDRVGSFQVVNQPFKLSGATNGARGHAPSLGEHTNAVLGENIARAKAVEGRRGGQE